MGAYNPCLGWERGSSFSFRPQIETAAIWYSDADCCAVGLRFESRRRHGCLKMCKDCAVEGTLNFHRLEGPFERLVGGKESCQVIYSQFGLAFHPNDHQARRRFVEWAQNEMAVVPDFHKRILFSDEAHFWLNGYVNKQNCRIWSEANPQVYVETPLHPEKLTVWCALWAGGILLQKR
ncbi:hypothetical protein TNCV_1154451 [Trichonephila clavipes]|nr:hypothetical protein TNCV_1154451 [Trichonephila clavipes]